MNIPVFFAEMEGTRENIKKLVIIQIGDLGPGMRQQARNIILGIGMFTLPVGILAPGLPGKLVKKREDTACLYCGRKIL